MRKTVCFFLLLSAIAVATHAQSYCDKQAPKISFSGRAPWSIDGKMNDWQIILGPYTGNVAVPYEPPRTSSFNWVIDGQQFENDLDHPQPQSDLNFLSFTHDDYNVYFYFRRQAVDASSNSFYYFLDINSDEVMSNGEPVVHGTFNNKTTSPLMLSRYVVNKKVNYNNGLLLNGFGDTVGKAAYGNYMDANPYGSTRESGNYDENGEGIDIPIEKFPLSGSLVELFNSASVSGNEKPKKGEVFNAALTEGGYGVELSIPIRYLRRWIPEKQKDKKDFKGKGNAKGRDKVKYEKTEPINIRTDIFFYHVSMLDNARPYNPAQVVDNAGSCRGGVGISGSPSVSTSIATTVLNPGRSYKFDITYTNLLSKPTEIGIEDIILHAQKNFETPINPTDYFITIYPDYNCNGKVDRGVEDVRNPLTTSIANDYSFAWFSYDDATSDYDTSTINLAPYFDDLVNNEPTENILPPLGKACFIAVLNIKPEKALSSFDITFESSLFFLNGLEFCEPSCGGKPINQVGTAKANVGTTTFRATKRVRPDTALEQRVSVTGVNVYPNPSNGNVIVTLPKQEGVAVIMLEDYLGRKVQQWRTTGSDRFHLTGLKRGSFILKVQFLKSGKVETRKIVVQ